ncbi:glutamate [NMDA] receptor subunit 1-like [Rhagoletis pomonella]|uniref:glutamate [NMDA] receptor subunit 1-like n=1 Tax=Rhagoletis pomonella TaxID=28610 RepID=UPI0017814727|nr:glutamate [NMDA] receptor subunit 1-like [Rhagoletis pomonella]
MKALIDVSTACLLICSIHLGAIAQKHIQHSDNPSTYNIGGVLTDPDSEAHFRTTIAHLNFDQQYVPRKVTYYDKTIRMDKNPIKTVFNVCDKLIEKRVSISNILFYFIL